MKIALLLICLIEVSFFSHSQELNSTLPGEYKCITKTTFVSLNIHRNQTFTYSERLYQGHSFECKGVWALSKNKSQIILTSYLSKEEKGGSLKTMKNQFFKNTKSKIIKEGSESYIELNKKRFPRYAIKERHLNHLINFSFSE